VTRRTRPGYSRALRSGAGASVLVLAVCAVIAGLSAATLGTVGAAVGAATARSSGEVVTTAGRTVEVRWSAPGAYRTDTIELATAAPPVGTRTEVAYDPHTPSVVLIPGSAELAAVDRAASGLAFSGLIGTMVLITLSWQLLSRRRLRTRPVQVLPARRVRVQSGLLTRSWLELETVPTRWIPVHFDPVLVTLPAPTSIRVHGDPARHRLVAADVDGVWLPPSGPVRTTEPSGRRIDSPARPDDDTYRVARFGWRRQLRADAALLTPAPLVGLLWAFLDDGGVLTWAGVTALTAALALWWAALRGSDPT
jgi:hypothetical protein